VFLRAEAYLGLNAAWREALVCEQSFKPAHDTLRKNGFRVERAVTGDGFDVALCLLTKHKSENLGNLGRAWALLRPGGMLVCAGGNDVGAGSIERAFRTAVGAVTTLSKHHCRIFWAERTTEFPALLTEWAAAGQMQMVPETGCWSRPGLYNWNKVDEGSALLAEHLPADLSGRVADLGCGWGYLSLKLLERPNAIASLDLFEAEAHALDAAKANLERLQSPAALNFHWHDVATGLPKAGVNISLPKAGIDMGLPKAGFDTIVMNPPFHVGKTTDVGLGQAFIAAAAPALARRGKLIFVANRHLPYEAIVAKAFRRSKVLFENGAYKIISAEV
jgi:16S rRNA (guanine1207-N2)-methyltransferase